MKNYGLLAVISIVSVACTLFFYFEHTNKGIIRSDLVYWESDPIRVSSHVNSRVISSNIKPGKRVVRTQELISLDKNELQLTLLDVESLISNSQNESQANISKIKQISSHLEQLEQAKLSQQEGVDVTHAALLKLQSKKDGLSVSIIDYTDAYVTLAERQYRLLTVDMEIQANQQNRTALEHRNVELALLIQQQKKRLSLEKSKTAFYDVVSPVDGIVSRVFTQEGESVRLGDPLFEIIPEGEAYLTAYLEERDIPGIVVGQSVNVTFDAYPSQPATGSIALINPVGGASMLNTTPNYTSGHISRISQRIPVRIYLDNKPADFPLSIGMSAKITIEKQ